MWGIKPQNIQGLGFWKAPDVPVLAMAGGAKAGWGSPGFRVEGSGLNDKASKRQTHSSNGNLPAPRPKDMLSETTSEVYAG
jgi:hypothetical protein